MEKYTECTMKESRDDILSMGMGYLHEEVRSLFIVVDHLARLVLTARPSGRWELNPYPFNGSLFLYASNPSSTNFPTEKKILLLTDRRTMYV